MDNLIKNKNLKRKGPVMILVEIYGNPINNYRLPTISGKIRDCLDQAGDRLPGYNRLLLSIGRDHTLFGGKGSEIVVEMKGCKVSDWEFFFSLLVEIKKIFPQSLILGYFQHLTGTVSTEV